MADIGSSIAEVIPSFGGNSVLTYVTWFIFLLIFMAGAIIATLLIMRRIKYNKQIIVFEKINGRLEVTRRDKAMEMSYSVGGDTVFFLRRAKKYLPIPKTQTGRRVYWYYIRQDGEWINFSPEDIDEKSKQMKVKMTDTDMRYARTQIQRGLKSRYDKPKFWERYGGLIINIAAIVIVLVMMWLIFQEWIDGLSKLAGVAEVNERVMEAAKDVLVSLENINAGGPGFRPA